LNCNKKFASISNSDQDPFRMVERMWRRIVFPLISRHYIAPAPATATTLRTGELYGHA
jgi:hypothetical protein